ncbi:MAG: hypothetical protein AAF317_06280 [Pseudomonadota bacterium]
MPIPLTFAGVLAILIALGCALLMARDGWTRAYYFVMFVVHSILCFGFWGLSLTERTDSQLYYRVAEWTDTIGLGTDFVSYLTGLLRRAFDISYLDGFLFFQIPGLVGLILLHKAAVRMSSEGFETRVIMLGFLLFLPGLQFWTTPIGKDGLAICAFGLIAYALAHRPFHWTPLIAGTLLYFMVRPHVAFVLVLAMALAFLPIFGQSTPRARFAGVGAAVTFVLMLPFVFLFVGIEDAGIEGVADFVAHRQAIGFRGGSAVDLADLSVFERVLTLWFRPFFIDASGIAALFASVENLVLVAIFGYLLYHARLMLRLLTVSEVLRFHLFFILILTAIFSQTIGNLGLALRQKMMMVPALLLLFAAVTAFLNRKREAAQEKILTAIRERIDEANSVERTGR